MRNIFLAGGGNEKDSFPTDRLFSSVIDKNKVLLYVPNAMISRSYEECLIWFKSVFSPLGIDKIEMWTDLDNVEKKDFSRVSGIYIGGGDTAKLFSEIESSNFKDYLLEAVNKGIPVYGGSAGAIVLGKDLRTAKEIKMSELENTYGLDVLSGYSVFCHYTPDKKEELFTLTRLLKSPIFALSEKTGIYIRDEIVTIYGTEPLYIIRDQIEIVLKPGEKHPIS